MKRKSKRFFFLILLIVDVIIFFLVRSGTKLIYNYGLDNFQTYVSNSSYLSVEKLIENGCDFENVYSISRNESGDIEMLSLNAFEINSITKDLSTFCYDIMDNYMQNGINMPIGVFSGINLLANSGPKINVKFLGNLSVCCELERTFVSAGINQTRHTLTAIITCEVYLYSVFDTKKYVATIQVPLIDNIIIGNVPQNYFVAEIIGENFKTR